MLTPVHRPIGARIGHGQARCLRLAVWRRKVSLTHGLHRHIESPPQASLHVPTEKPRYPRLFASEQEHYAVVFLFGSLAAHQPVGITLFNVAGGAQTKSPQVL